MNMVERVARAICLAELPTDRNWEICVPAALAAIKAMREPTNEMLRAADDATIPDEVLMSGPFEMFKAEYQAAIDEALGDA